MNVSDFTERERNLLEIGTSFIETCEAANLSVEDIRWLLSHLLSTFETAIEFTGSTDNTILSNKEAGE